jgi:hypothetical protein
MMSRGRMAERCVLLHALSATQISEFGLQVQGPRIPVNTL